MEMQLNQKFLRDQRIKRAWSQSQLAEASGLSIRTIQRLEKTGSASQESVQALASVFEVNVSDLIVQKTNSRKRIATITSILAFFTGALIFLPVSAKPIMVDVELSSQSENIVRAQLLSEDNKESELIVDGMLRLVIKSIEEPDNKVRIFASLYLVSGDKEELVATPQLVTKNNKPAEIRFEDYAVLLTPHI